DRYMQGLGEAILESMKSVKAAVARLADFRGASEDMVSSTRSDIMEMYKRCSKSENRADEILREALKEIMSKSDAKDIIKYKEIYEGLETVTDKCVDAMDIISDISLRYTYHTKK
ncbi:hypothetical protein B1B_15786, partial [mine drainage metagenome]